MKLKKLLLIQSSFYIISNSSSINHLVPKVRIELTADPYQGPVLPLNYIGIIKVLTFLLFFLFHLLYHSILKFYLILV